MCQALLKVLFRKAGEEEDLKIDKLCGRREKGDKRQSQAPNGFTSACMSAGV